MDSIKDNKMGSSPIFRLIITMSLPAMFSMLVQSLYNIVDSIFVSSLGQDALTALSLAFPVQTLMIAMAVGTSVGVNSLISRRLGEGRRDDKQCRNPWFGAVNYLLACFRTAGYIFYKTFL